MEIRNLFDPSRDIDRQIEKVITYGADEEQRLKAEISEYVVTASIEDQIEKVLRNMQAAMEAGGQSEVGVWVSGFYGSGKSSLTKYLGLAFDDRITIDDKPFLDHLQNRLHKPETKALLSTVAKRFPAAVVLLDLASEQVAGATLAEISTVLYYKALQWAGYSKNLKVAALERKLRGDDRYEEFERLFIEETGSPWKDYQNDPLVVGATVPGLAHQIYPDLFKTSESYNSDTSEFVELLDARVQNIIDIVREASGKEYIFFVIDEVGQYVSSNQNKILDLQGLAENLKNKGDGKVWIFGTAQQTLTEDDERAAINSPELYKVKDRFPIQVDLESKDIKEICYRRLLTKATTGATQLSLLFNQHGQALRQNTKLHDAKFYDADFDEQSFVELYPFMPAQFDILLHLLGALAKSTGGIGLRSAIKVVQEILTQGPDGQSPAAHNPVGWLATTVTLYDALEKDIQRAFPSHYQAVGKVSIRFPDSELHHQIAKAVAVLQILNNLPATVENVASLIHPAVDSPPNTENVKTVIEELLTDEHVPLGEKEGALSFFSEKLNDLEQRRAQLPLRIPDTRRVFNESLRALFTPLPSARIHGSLAVRSGLKVQIDSKEQSLEGDRDHIQTIIELVDASDYDTARTRLTDESRQRSSENAIYLLSRKANGLDDHVAEIYRAQRIVEENRSDPDQEIKEYCAGQTDRASRLSNELQQRIARTLLKGSFIFRGQVTAVDSLAPEVLDACKRHLATTAEQVFDRLNEAADRVETSVAEKFLKTPNLAGMTRDLDPLGLVQPDGGTVGINTQHKALVSIRDYLDRSGRVQGKELLEHFSRPPYGWSQDTLRYLIAAFLVAGAIKLTIAGRDITNVGKTAIDALKTNNAFKSVGVASRHDQIDKDVLARAAERLMELIGDQVLPLEQAICKSALKNLPKFQHDYGSLAEKLDSLELPGVDKVRNLNRQIADLLLTDASDAPHQLGAEDSSLYEELKRAQASKLVLEQGLESTIKELRAHQRAIEGLPSRGIPGELRTEATPGLELLADRLTSEDFYKHTADLNTTLTELKTQVSRTASEMISAQKQQLQHAERDLKSIPEWNELTQEEQNNALAGLDDLNLEFASDLNGLDRLIAHDYDVQSQVRELKNRIVRDGRERQRQRVEEQKKKEGPDGGDKAARTIKVSASISKISQLEELITQLQQLKGELTYYDQFELTITPTDKSES